MGKGRTPGAHPPDKAFIPAVRPVDAFQNIRAALVAGSQWRIYADTGHPRHDGYFEETVSSKADAVRAMTRLFLSTPEQATAILHQVKISKQAERTFGFKREPQE